MYWHKLFLTDPKTDRNSNFLDGDMRILAIADNVENWLSDAEMRRLAEESDVVITLGDVYGCDLEKVTVPGTPVVGVYGNHCRPDYISALGGLTSSLTEGDSR